MNTTDTLFVLVCAAMVLLMTPALAVFYAGLCRRKSGVDIMMQVWICLAVVGLLWAAVGFSLAFGPDTAKGLLGSPDYLLLQGVGLEANPAFSPRVPFIAYFFLQTAYAVITPALICGATAERMTLKAWVAFVLLWSLVVYIPLAHMTWGGGLFARFGLAGHAADHRTGEAGGAHGQVQHCDSSKYQISEFAEFRILRQARARTCLRQNQFCPVS